MKRWRSNSCATSCCQSSIFLHHLYLPIYADMPRRCTKTKTRDLRIDFRKPRPTAHTGQVIEVVVTEVVRHDADGELLLESLRPVDRARLHRHCTHLVIAFVLLLSAFTQYCNLRNSWSVWLDHLSNRSLRGERVEQTLPFWDCFVGANA